MTPGLLTLISPSVPAGASPASAVILTETPRQGGPTERNFPEEPEGGAEEGRREGAADQPHVVIEGQPRDDDIVASELGGLGHEGHRPRDIGMTQDHPARKTRASRRVLDEGDVILGDRGKGGR